VLTTYAFSMVYLQLTGSYFFFDSNVPIAVFLGMHLLFTDPSTAPRTELGRIIFGILYGLSVVGLYALLGALGAPTFYDKLLQVLLLNLMIKAIDRLATSRPLAWLSPERLGATLVPRMRSLAYVSLWIVVFGAMTLAKGVGDYHPGHTVPFWEQACRDGRRNGCRNLAVLERRHCEGGSGWACNELGILGANGRAETLPPDQLFQQACALGFTAGCRNAAVVVSNATGLRHDEPTLRDFPIVLREGKGVAADPTPFDIVTRACRQGWAAGCGSLAAFYIDGRGPVPVDKPRAAALWEQACAGGHARSCSNIGFMFNVGDGVVKDSGKARVYLKRSCDLGFASACRWLAEQPR